MKKIIQFLLITSLTSCFSNVDPESQTSYIETKSDFPASLTKYLPSILPYEFNSYSFSLGGSELAVSKYIEVGTRYNYKWRYNSKKKQLLLNSSYSLSPTDSCITKVFSEYVWDKKEFLKIISELNDSCTSKYPIPDFLINESTLPNNVIHIIDSDTTYYFMKEDRPEIRYLPSNWEKGYSVGFTINDEYLIIKYWLILW